MKEILKKLGLIQATLKAPKGQYNSFGKYSYRSCEDILESVKPLLGLNSCTLTITDEVLEIGARYYIKATATIYDIESGEFISNTALAREEDAKRGMDGSQITGAASSYARKYALNGLFCIDDNKDADTNEHHEQKANQSKQYSNTQPKQQQSQTATTNSEQFFCEKCGNLFEPYFGVDTVTGERVQKMTAKQVYEYSKTKNNGSAYCTKCMNK